MSNVCAIILDYFGKDKTITCLTSLIIQGLDTVLIIDNSGDQKANIQLKTALDNFNQNNIPFTIHRMVNKQNLGFAKGVNNALRWLEKNHPHSHYLLINNDAQATPGMLRVLLDFMHHNEKTTLVSPVMDTGKNKIFYNWYHRFTGLLFGHYVYGTFPYLSGCCLLVDGKIAGNGLFDEDFFMYGEDVELTWRARASGYKPVCVNNATVRHEMTGSSHQGDFFYEYHMVMGHIILALKLAKHSWEIPFLFLGRFLTMSSRAIVRSIRFRTVVPIEACLKAWVNYIMNEKNIHIK